MTIHTIEWSREMSKYSDEEEEMVDIEEGNDELVKYALQEGEEAESS